MRVLLLPSFPSATFPLLCTLDRTPSPIVNANYNAAHPVPIENIKELRSGPSARYYREQFNFSTSYESRWLTIIYVLEGRYKTWHVIAPTRDVFMMWDVTLRRLFGVRQELMSGLGNGDLREAVWERQYWKGAEEGAGAGGGGNGGNGGNGGENGNGGGAGDQRLSFEDVERLCKRLNINPSKEDLLRRFQVSASSFYLVLYSLSCILRLRSLLACERV